MGRAGSYCIRDGYTSRTAPDYFHDDHDLGGVLWQPDVYRLAQRVARKLGSPTVIDVGAGNGEKLSQVPPRLERIGLDFGENLERGRHDYAGIRWHAYDAEQDARLPVTSDELQRSLLVCADVIEHLPHPDRLVGHLKRAFVDGASACVLSTPDRERTAGFDHDGPPTNPHHVREWTRDELIDFLSSQGFMFGAAGWTRSHNYTLERNTILIVLARDAETLHASGTARFVSRGFADLQRHLPSEARITAATRGLWLYDRAKKAAARARAAFGRSDH